MPAHSSKCTQDVSARPFGVHRRLEMAVNYLILSVGAPRFELGTPSPQPGGVPARHSKRDVRHLVARQSGSPASGRDRRDRRSPHSPPRRLPQRSRLFSPWV